jgi:phosphoglycolate phosphatase
MSTSWIYFPVAGGATLVSCWQARRQVVGAAADHAVITDLDNTIYDFARYYEAGLTGLVSRICSEFDFGIAEATARLREVYTARKSIEYPFAIEEFPELKSMPQTSRSKFVREALAAFWDGATGQLEAYRTVRETLRHLDQEGIPVIAYTDAPIHEAMRRLRALEIDCYFTGIVAQSWFHRKNGTIIVLLDELPGHRRTPRHLKFVWRASWDNRKPCELIYRKIALGMGINLRNIVVIGDSIERDLQPAIDLGCIGIWASYGKRSSGSEGLLRQVIPHLLPEVRDIRNEPPGKISEACQFEDVVQYLPIQQFLIPG